MAAWLALPYFVLGAAGLNVDSLSPDALCPPLEETRAAVAARLGNVELEGTWHATYVLVHRTQGDFVSLSLSDPEGVLRLTRELPVQGGSCATLSRVIALVLERFFMRPEQTATPEPSPAAEPALLTTEPAPSSAPAEPAPTPGPASEPPPARDLPREASTQKPRPFRLAADLWATTSWLAPSLRLSRDFAERYSLSLNAGFDLSDHETRVFEGSVLVRRAPVSIAAERHFGPSARLDTYASVEILGLLEDAQTTALADSGGGLRVVPGLGARLGSRLFGDSAAQPFVELTAAWLMRWAAPAFRVGGDEVLTPKSLVFGLALGIGTPL